MNIVCINKVFIVSSQGLCFLTKTECNVRDVEVARAIRLGKTTIEPLAFKVPRVRVRHTHLHIWSRHYYFLSSSEYLGDSHKTTGTSWQ